VACQTSQSASRPGLAPGTVIRDTYTVVELLGSGRFADAYLVRHRYMGMQVMKLLVDGLSDADRVEGLQEAFLLSRISHPGIVRIFDANRIETTLGGHPYITMEYVGGGTLETHLKQESDGLTLEVALEFGRQIAVALGHAHDAEGGVIHRDVKPANILLDPQQESGFTIRISDFGLACRVNQFTQVAEAGGTVLYMSPESLRGYEIAASDIFSAGLVLYEMLTGMLPYPRRTFSLPQTTFELKRSLRSLHERGLPPPSSFDSNIPPDVDSVVMRALHPDDTFRFHSGVSLANAIEACQHVQRSEYSKHADSQFHAEIRTIFASVTNPVLIAQGVEQLESLLGRNKRIAHGYSSHLDQIRDQWQRYRFEQNQ
jgi:eukaryotic-like serine/threonine-protein kinase